MRIKLPTRLNNKIEDLKDKIEDLKEWFWRLKHKLLATVSFSSDSSTFHHNYAVLDQIFTSFYIDQNIFISDEEIPLGFDRLFPKAKFHEELASLLYIESHQINFRFLETRSIDGEQVDLYQLKLLQLPKLELSANDIDEARMLVAESYLHASEEIALIKTLESVLSLRNREETPPIDTPAPKPKGYRIDANEPGMSRREYIESRRLKDAEKARGNETGL